MAHEVKGCDDERGKDGKIHGAADHKPLIVNGTLRRVKGPARRSSKANWTAEEDYILQEAVKTYKGKSWKKIANCLPGRTDVQCLHRWQKVLNPDLVKGPWSKEEDSLLLKLVEKQSGKSSIKWSEIAEQLPGRIGKQCRERWFNHLNPEIKKSPWTREEEETLINMRSQYGNKWSEIAKILGGRTENSVKNHWNCSLKKKICYYLANGGKNTETLPTLGEAKRNPSTECLREETTENGNRRESFSLDLTLGFTSTSSNQKPPLEKGNTPACASPSYNDASNANLNHFSLDENEACTPHAARSDPAEPSSEHFAKYPNQPPMRPRRHSDICHSNLALMHQILSDDDPVEFLPTDIRQPNGSLSEPPSIRFLINRLRNRAISYENVPNIIRKREIRTMEQKDVSTPDKVVGSLHEAERVEDDDGRVVNLRRDVVFSPKCRKLEVLKSVGKCLERDFSDA